MAVGALMAVVFGGITLAVWLQGGPLWKGSIPVALGLIFFGMGLRARLRSLLLWRSGEVCEGEIVHAWTKQTGGRGGPGTQTTHLVQYEYVVDGKQHLTRHGILGVWKNGPIWVIYDAKNPSHSMPERGS